MKKILKLHVLTLIATCALAAFTGCATSGTSDPVAVAARLQDDAYDVGFAGALYAIRSDASLKADFDEASKSLAHVAAKQTLTAADLLTVLQPLLDRVRELRSARGALYITAGRLILRRATGQLDVTSTAYIQGVARGLSAGFADAVK